jgi:hypothetical protein
MNSISCSCALINHAIMIQWRGGISPHIPISALDGDELSASLSDCFTHWERAPVSLIRGWVDPRAIADKVMEIYSFPSGNNSCHLACSYSLYRMVPPHVMKSTESLTVT